MVRGPVSPSSETLYRTWTLPLKVGRLVADSIQSPGRASLVADVDDARLHLGNSVFWQLLLQLDAIGVKTFRCRYLLATPLRVL